MQVFNCPSSEVTWRGQYTGNTRYGVNAELTYYWQSSRVPAKMGDLVRPADTIIIADSDWTRSTNDYDFSNSWALRRTPHVSRFIPARHNDGANIVYCDGHAKWSQVPLDPNYTGDGSVPLTQNPPGILWHPDGRW